MLNRRHFLQGAAVLPAAAALTPAHAQAAYPTRNVTIVVPFPPGGTADFAARPIAQGLSERLGRQFVVENKGGAGGGVGHAQVARAEPDGYTLMVTLPSLAVIPEANRLQGKPVTYEMDQFVPLARIFGDPPILGVKKNAPWKNVQEFIDDVRKNPGKIPYGTSGQFGTVHLAMEMFLKAAGLKMLHVPYQGGGPAFNALLSDQVPVVPTLESIAKGHLESGDVRVLAHWGTEPQKNLPGVPALRDVGYPEVQYLLWAGLFAPRGTPENVQKILRDAVRGYMQEKANLERFLKAGSQPAYLDGPEFAKFLEADTARLVKVTREIGLS